MEAARFRMIVHVHEQDTYRAAYRILADRDEALDVTQEAFLALFRNASRIQADRIGGWLYRVATNRALDRIRRRRPSLSAEPAALPAPGSGPAEAAQRREERERVLRALARLPERQRQVLTLRVLEQRTFPEIRRTLGISEGAAKVHFRRGLQALRRRVVKETARGDER